MPVYEHHGFVVVDGEAQFAAQVRMQWIKAFVLRVGDFENPHVERTREAHVVHGPLVIVAACRQPHGAFAVGLGDL